MSNFGIQYKVLLYNYPQFKSKFFQVICVEPEVKPLATAVYDPETCGQLERFDDANISGLHQFIAEHQQNWERYVVLFTYAYKSPVYSATILPPFSLVL